MSQTTTAAESRRRGCPSFDSVWANLPEELSPTSGYHGESFVFDDDDHCLNVNNLCRNTFLHLDSSSPLARLSVQDLVRSFKEFSTTIKNQHEDENYTATSSLHSYVSPDRQNKWPAHSGGTPETAVTGAGSQSDDWPVVSQGSLVELVNTYSFKANEDEEGDLLLLTPSPVVQSLLNRREPQQPEQSIAINPTELANSTPQPPDSPTIYRDGHPLSCKPCAFFWSKGCLNGNNCQFCHLWHVPKRKKPMREQRNLMIIAKEDGKITFLRCSIKDVIN